MSLIYKKATLEDIDILTETRIEVLRAAFRSEKARDYNYFP